MFVTNIYLPRLTLTQVLAAGAVPEEKNRAARQRLRRLASLALTRERGPA